jgi:hypothetical protein
MATYPARPTVPVAAGRHLEGWSSCCGAAVTFSGDGALCCKKCWHEVDTQYVTGELAERLDAIIYAALTGTMTCDAAVASQRDLLGYPSVEAAKVSS